MLLENESQFEECKRDLIKLGEEVFTLKEFKAAKKLIAPVGFRYNPNVFIIAIILFFINEEGSPRSTVQEIAKFENEKEYWDTLNVMKEKFRFNKKVMEN